MNVTSLAASGSKTKYKGNTEPYKKIGIAEHERFEKEAELHMTKNDHLKNYTLSILKFRKIKLSAHP